jgi:hypothetical protein
MTPISWHDAYYSELQSLYSLLVVPVAFLAWRLAAPTDPARAVVPKAAHFVAAATLVFALLTMLDPIVTGPFLKSEALQNTLAATLVPFVFVFLGDWRVLLVALAVADPEAPLARTLGRATAATAIVPIATGILYTLLRWLWPEIHGQSLWMIYEAGFLALCVYAARVWLPRQVGLASALGAEGRAFLGALFGYSAAYYALWLAADVVVVVAGLDLGWAIRMVPNQLYYAFWTPFVYLRFFSGAPAKSVRSAA